MNRFTSQTLILVALMIVGVDTSADENVNDKTGQSGAATALVHKSSDSDGKGQPSVSSSKLHRPLPESLTSFGACVVDEYLYVFSGHSGEAHGFGKDLLVDHFRRIKFDDASAEWEELAMHDSAQSTALVTDGKDIYRIGGLSFLKGDEDGDGEEDAIFNSTDHFVRYNIEKNEWTQLAPLPSPRSSLDAAIVGRTIYVV
ncbi:MAG: hypothetical protein AAFN70_08000, partial [Planctomycetota bacterium]